MKLNGYTLAALIFVMLFGGIGLSSAMNWWQTESSKIPVVYTEGEAAGQYDPADIRGSYTFGEVSDLFDVPLVALQSAFRLPAGSDPASYPLKSLEDAFADLPVEIGTGSVRMFVAFYHGLPFVISAEEDTYLFAEATEILKEHNKMLPEQASYLEEHTLVESVQETLLATPQVVETQPASVPTEHSAPDKTVTGKTTFQDLLDWGVTQAAIESILGDAMPATQTEIKSYLSLKGLEFSTLKTKFQAEVDKE